MTGRGRRAVMVGAVLMLLPLLGCGPSAAPPVNAPVLQVVTALYPLQQAIEQIGQAKVAVTNVVPAGENPLTYRLPVAAVESVRHAALVVQIGGGFQPAFEAAARSAHDVVSLLPAGQAASPYVWLDPTLMVGALGRLSSAMEAANPAAAHYYRQGEQGFAQLVQSTGIDYDSTLSTCPIRVIFTPDHAFASMAQRYGLKDQVVTGSAGDGTLAAVQNSQATTLFTEPWVDNTAVETLAGQTHRQVRDLDTLLGPPAGGWPAGATYINLMEANLGALNNALGCGADSTS